MLREFIDFVESILPAVSPDTKNAAKEAIAQFEGKGEKLKYMTLRPLKELSQGDILSKIPFSYFGDDGEQKYFVTEALVLSTSCHIDQKNSVVLVPVFPLEKFEGNIQELKKNKIFDYMYIPDGIMSDKYIDFEYMNTYSKKLIMLGFEKDKVCRIGSLNQLGYYFFIVKLTVYLMRKEDRDTLIERNKEMNARYVFGFSLKNMLVTEEYLYFFPNGRQAKIFERDDKDFTTGSKFRGKLSTCKDVLKPNRLLLSCAANFSSVKEIEDAYKFFSDELVIYSSNNQDNWMQYSLYQINTNEEVKQSVIRFMQNLGIGLRDIEVTIDQKKVEADELPPFLDSKFKNIILQGNVDSITVKVIYDGFEIDLIVMFVSVPMKS